MPKITKSILTKELQNIVAPPKETTFWKGPLVQGVTQSKLGSYITCPERFRISSVLGFDKPEEFNKNMDYGHMWHTCEEYYYGNKGDWKEALKVEATKYINNYPHQQDEIYKWYRVCLIQFPTYLEYWKKHSHEKTRKNIFTEKEFRVEYYPAGYKGKPFILRGKWDGLDVIAHQGLKGIFFQENKTKSEIDDLAITRNLKFDIQTMFYLVALYVGRANLEELKAYRKLPIAGVRYNVIRRPLSGGKGSIVRHKATKNKREESLEEYYARLEEVIKENDSSFFARYTVLVQPWEIKLFQEEFLDPVLLNIKDDYEWWDFCLSNDEDVYNYQLREEQFKDHKKRHFRLPYGVWNPIAEGYRASVDDYLDNKSLVGLVKRSRVFPELSED